MKGCVSGDGGFVVEGGVGGATSETFHFMYLRKLLRNVLELIQYFLFLLTLLHFEQLIDVPHLFGCPA